MQDHTSNLNLSSTSTTSTSSAIISSSPSSNTSTNLVTAPSSPLRPNLPFLYPRNTNISARSENLLDIEKNEHEENERDEGDCEESADHVFGLASNLYIDIVSDDRDDMVQILCDIPLSEIVLSKVHIKQYLAFLKDQNKGGTISFLKKQALKFEDCHFEEGVFSDLAKGLAELNTLQKLSFVGCKFNSIMINMLCPVFNANPKLHSFALENNGCTEQMMKKLMGALINSPCRENLRTLFLSNTSIGDSKAVDSLIEHLREFNKLENVYLNGCNLTEDHCKSLGSISRVDSNGKVLPITFILDTSKDLQLPSFEKIGLASSPVSQNPKKNIVPGVSTSPSVFFPDLKRKEEKEQDSESRGNGKKNLVEKEDRDPKQQKQVYENSPRAPRTCRFWQEVDDEDDEQLLAFVLAMSREDATREEKSMHSSSSSSSSAGSR